MGRARARSSRRIRAPAPTTRGRRAPRRPGPHVDGAQLLGADERAAHVGGPRDIAEVDERSRHGRHAGMPSTTTTSSRSAPCRACTRIPARERAAVPRRDGHMDRAGPRGEQVQCAATRRRDWRLRPRRMREPPRDGGPRRASTPTPTAYTPCVCPREPSLANPVSDASAREPDACELGGRHEPVLARRERRDGALALVMRARVRIPACHWRFPAAKAMGQRRPRPPHSRTPRHT